MTTPLSLNLEIRKSLIGLKNKISKWLPLKTTFFILCFRETLNLQKATNRISYLHLSKTTA